jgi:hypothetical protein
VTIFLPPDRLCFHQPPGRFGTAICPFWQVFMEISFDGQSAGRIEFDLFCGWAERWLREPRAYPEIRFHGISWISYDLHIYILYIYTCIHIYTYTYIYMYVYIYTRIYIYLCFFIIQIHIYTSIHPYMHIYIYVHINIYAQID